MQRLRTNQEHVRVCLTSDVDDDHDCPSGLMLLFQKVPSHGLSTRCFGGAPVAHTAYGATDTWFELAHDRSLGTLTFVREGAVFRTCTGAASAITYYAKVFIYQLSGLADVPSLVLAAVEPPSPPPAPPIHPLHPYAMALDICQDDVVVPSQCLDEANLSLIHI